MFGYNNDSWSTHTSLGAKNNTANQIAAFFSDITTFTSHYENPVVKNSGITVDEYIYIKHHDGPNATDFVSSQGLKISVRAIFTWI
ncbi:hypothetical protein [Azorhizophilus paspali]|uniref:Uncharacterized protein n=1 Tax=Azorhizophilus paspali TaxID=69963 RepID=A0ABV6SPC7_AZOPA